MSRNNFCPFCNMVVAIGDPDRVVYDDQSAHVRCILKSEEMINLILEYVRKHLESFLLPDVLDFWNSTISSTGKIDRQTMIYAFKACFEDIDEWRDKHGEEGPYTWPYSEVVDTFRGKISRILMFDF